MGSRLTVRTLTIRGQLSLMELVPNQIIANRICLTKGPSGQRERNYADKGLKCASDDATKRSSPPATETSI